MKRILQLVIYFLLIGFSACKKERSDEAAFLAISGKWFQERNWSDDIILREVYEFRNDHTFERTAAAIDKTDGKIKGYINKTTASFSIKEDSLVLKGLKMYGVKTYGYKKLEELESISEYNKQSYKTVFSADKDTLTLLFYCPPNANCIFPRLTRVK